MVFVWSWVQVLSCILRWSLAHYSPVAISSETNLRVWDLIIRWSWISSQWEGKDNGSINLASLADPSLIVGQTQIQIQIQIQWKWKVILEDKYTKYKKSYPFSFSLNIKGFEPNLFDAAPKIIKIGLKNQSRWQSVTASHQLLVGPLSSPLCFGGGITKGWIGNVWPTHVHL